jgi:2-phosphosulfolactate phosphatase
MPVPQGATYTMHWHCHDLFQRMPAGATAGGVAVVIDVLRASTTMITALASGAAAVWPVADVDEARALARRLGPRAILGGERGGVMIEGFALGNSPTEYVRDRIGGHDVVLTTTNGTAALAACAAAAETLVAAIVNRRAVAAAVRTLGAARGLHHAHLVCAGTDGSVTAEDVLAAGAILDAAAIDPGAAADTLDAAAERALAAFRQLVVVAAARASTPEAIAAALVAAFRTSPGGANLVDLGMASDLPVCARLDAVPVVPRLERTTGRAVVFR